MQANALQAAIMSRVMALTRAQNARACTYGPVMTLSRFIAATAKIRWMDLESAVGTIHMRYLHRHYFELPTMPRVLRPQAS